MQKVRKSCIWLETYKKLNKKKIQLFLDEKIEESFF